MVITDNDIERFGSWLNNKEKAPSTVSKYCTSIKALEEYLAGQEVKKANLICFKHDLETTHTPRTVNGYITAINNFLAFSHLSRMKLSAIRIQQKPFIDDSKYLSYDEYVRLVQESERRGQHQLTLIMETLASCGLRVSELPYVTVGSIVEGQTTVYLKGKARTIILTAGLRSKLQGYIQERGVQSGTVFVTKYGNPINRTNIGKDMKKLAPGAKVDPSKVFPHNLRHLFARAYYEESQNISMLSAVMGHSSIETTRQYTAVSIAEHRMILEKLRFVI